MNTLDSVKFKFFNIKVICNFFYVCLDMKPFMISNCTSFRERETERERERELRLKGL